MTLHGDRVTCDVPGCEASIARRLLWGRAPWGGAWRIGRGNLDICPACRNRYTDDELRDLLARKETQ